MGQSKDLNQIDRQGSDHIGSTLIENVARGLGASSIFSIKPVAKYMSGARCTIKINDRLAGFAFGVSWSIETDVTPIRTIDNYLPHELAPRQIRVTGTLSGFRVPGESMDSKSIQSNIVNFLISKYISIEVRDSQSDNRIFQTQQAIVTGRHERIEAGKLMETELTWEAIGWIDETSPAPNDFGSLGSLISNIL